MKAVIDALLEKKEIAPNIYVFGSNMGGTVAIQYAAIDERVKGVMATAPYKDFVSYARRGRELMSQKDFDDVIARAGKIADFDPQAASAVLAAAQLKCPLLIVYGFLDLWVPRQDSEAIIAAAPEPRKLLDQVPSIVMATVMEDWIADTLDKLARTGLPK